MKRILVLLMVSVMLLFTACGNENNTDTQISSVSNSTDSENNSSVGNVNNGDVVHIKTPEDMLALAERVNNGEKTLSAVLDADIDMSVICGPSIGNWTPINGMEGDFDGNGHKISNLYCIQSSSVAPFSDFKGNIRNLEIVDVVMESTEKKAAGLLLGFGDDSGRVVENCRVSGSVKGYEEAGGITTYIGRNNSIVNSVNEAHVEAGYYKGGSLYGSAGGIISRENNYNGDMEYFRTIRGCINKGEITLKGKYAGGIIGSCSDKFLIEDCINEGKVNDNLDLDLEEEEIECYVGGIAGGVGKNTIINRCINKGEISGCYIVGGIAGSSYAIINCANHGNVEAIGRGGYACGISAKTIPGIVNCYNTGTITTESFATGIGGSSSQLVVNNYMRTDKVVNVYNYGTVTYSGDKYVNLTDVVPWGDDALMNSWSRKGCIVSLKDKDHDSDQEEYGTAETEFKNGTVLNELNSAVENINNNIFTQYDEVTRLYLEESKKECDYEIDKWIAGADGLPKFEWE